MDRGQLEAVVVLSEELHFGSAARRLGISQPALSQKLQKLEGDIGVSLFVRSHRKVSLTEAGRAFLVQGRSALAEIESAVRTARKAARGQIGSLHVGFVENASLNILPGAVSAFRRAHPEVDLRLSEMISSELFERVASGRLDVALARPTVAGADLETRLVHREPYVAVLPEDHEFARLPAVQVADLAQLPMIIAAGAKATYVRMQFAPLFAQSGYEINVGQEVNQLPAILGLVSSGIGYALQPRSVAKMSTAGVIYRPLAVANAPEAELVAAWRLGETNPTVKRFLACLPEHSGAA